IAVNLRPDRHKLACIGQENDVQVVQRVEVLGGLFGELSVEINGLDVDLVSRAAWSAGGGTARVVFHQSAGEIAAGPKEPEYRGAWEIRYRAQHVHDPIEDIQPTEAHPC